MAFLTVEQSAKLMAWKAALSEVVTQYNAATEAINEILRAHENPVLNGNVIVDAVWTNLKNQLDVIRDAAIDAAKALPKKNE